MLVPPANTPVAGRPLVNLTFAINYALGGLDVGGYHVVNLALHLLCALLIFGLVRRTLDDLGWGRNGRPDRDLAWAVALLWTVHPLNSEVVDYLTQRTESMMALCYLLTIYAAMRGLTGRHRGAWQTVAVAACFGGMASKETMVAAPVMVILYDAVFVFSSLREAVQKRWPFYASLAAAWIFLAILVVSNGQTGSSGFSTARTSPSAYLLNQAIMLPRYLRLAVWPSSLVLYYGWPRTVTLAEIWPSGVLIIALLLGTLVALVRWPKVGFLGAWVFVSLAPTSSLVPIATEVGAERRMYLALAGLITLAVVGTAALWR